MRIVISPNQGELLRMKYRERLAIVEGALRYGYSVLSVLQGEMAQDMCQHDIDALEAYAIQLRAVLSSNQRRPLPK